MLTLLCCIRWSIIANVSYFGKSMKFRSYSCRGWRGSTCSHSFPKILFPRCFDSLSHSVISKHQIRCRISSHHQFIIIVNQKEIPFAWDIFSLSSGKIAQNSSHSFTFKLAAQAFLVWNHFLTHKYSFILTKNYCRRRNHQMKGFIKVQLLSIFRIWARILNRWINND